MITTQQYDYLNRITGINSANSYGSNLVSFSYTYNSANQRCSITNKDDNYWEYQYDSLGQVISGKNYWSDGTPVAGQQFSYSFDDIGNRKGAAKGGDSSGNNLHSSNYTNNLLNQVSARSVPGYVDELGEANSNATVTLNLMPAYRHFDYFQKEIPVTNTAEVILQSLTNLAVLNNGTNPDIISSNIGSKLLVKTPQAFAYDADGNLTNDGLFSYAWDGENQLVDVTSLTNVPPTAKIKVNFAYDYQGRRTQKIVWTNNGHIYIPENTNYFVYDGWNLIAEVATDDSLIGRYLWGYDLSGSEQGAGGVGGLLEASYFGTAPTNCFVAFDGNGNIADLVNADDGTVVGQREYGPFGETIRQTGGMAKAVPFGYATKFEDIETGLYNYGYRYYDPVMGRWNSRDPIEGTGEVNLYGFNKNDPVDFYDFLGMQKEIKFPSATIFSWIQQFDGPAASDDLSGYYNAFAALKGRASDPCARSSYSRSSYRISAIGK